MVCGRLTRRMLTRRRTGQVCRDGGPKYLSSSPRGESRSAKPHQDHPLGPQLFRTLRLQASQLYRKRPLMIAIRLFLDVAATLVRCSRACDASFRCQRQLQIPVPLLIEQRAGSGNGPPHQPTTTMTLEAALAEIRALKQGESFSYRFLAKKIVFPALLWQHTTRVKERPVQGPGLSTNKSNQK
jgi:hypothetical protein